MPSPVKKPRILVVEDEIIVARDIQAQLQTLGYEPVGHAARGLEAIDLAGELRPDLVLMDIQLAGTMDGIAAAQAIRTQFALPVVFLTAFAADDTLARVKLTEPFGYVLKPFTERELRTVLEMALYKHKAEAALRVSTRQLQALSQRVLEVQETERRRVAIELHDELGQSLTAIKINLQAQERFKKQQSPTELNAENIRIVDDALQQVRRLALALRPSMLDDLGLSPALQWIAEQTASRSGLSVQLHTPPARARLAPDIETACFRIVQEALTNITRHARARQVAIELQQDGDMLDLCVKDDGCGFDLAAMRERAMSGGSIGVLGMQERAMLIGGQLEIESTPGQGSAVRLRCPWRVAQGQL
ncbi:response regulator [Rhodoferax sp.]|uniref:response regulator n=1 Tax=Rhodoferax sp. TaxID=50421 RepID=UPI001EB388AC|nr:response regulator [Rhodoferax sp.]MBT9507522.1 response regulator [Rhodoferax sp.]